MKYLKTQDGYIAKLSPNEKIMTSLTNLVKENNIKTGIITGIGALTNVELGFFNLSKKIYERKTFAENYELISLTGNITWENSNPVIHAHAVISGPDYKALAGHLFEGEITVTGEIFITEEKNINLKRSIDQTFGLKLLDL